MHISVAIITCDYAINLCAANYLNNTVHGPKIITHPTDTSAGAPFSALFTCSASGFGELSIEWKRVNSSDVPVKSYHTQLYTEQFTTSTFIIPNVTDDDSGEYYCIGWIGLEASRSKTAMLYYSGKLNQ